MVFGIIGVKLPSVRAVWPVLHPAVVQEVVQPFGGDAKFLGNFAGFVQSDLIGLTRVLVGGQSQHFVLRFEGFFLLLGGDKGKQSLLVVSWGEPALHLVERRDVRFLEPHRLFAGVAHNQESETVAGDEILRLRFVLLVGIGGLHEIVQSPDEVIFGDCAYVL